MSSMSTTVAHPRPDFVRPGSSITVLNGTWDFAFDDDDNGIAEQWYNVDVGVPQDKLRDITVPFVYQTSASGIDEQQAHQIVWYQRTIESEPVQKGTAIVLKFGAVDYETDVWINGLKLGSHLGGHVPFEFDITDAIALGRTAEAILTVRVWDAATDLTQPRGKQYWAAKPEGIFYIPSTGIWQSVWLETVPRTRIADSSYGTVVRSHQLKSGELEAEIAIQNHVRAQDISVQLTASLEGIQVAKSDIVKVDAEKSIASLVLNMRLSEDQISQLQDHFTKAHPRSDPTCWLENVALWSPEHPILYDLTITLLSSTNELIDTVQTYTGMRSISWDAGDATLRLNNQPYFHALVLDQGYWPSTNMTPPTSTSCKEDIILAKNMGFNGCRKHQKVEDPSFLYWADKLGFLVWGEMANAYEFSNQYVSRFDHEWIEAVKRDINHPCVVAWTPINETWGYTDLAGDVRQQNHIRSLYYTTKTLDPTRCINDNCGWEHVCTDLTTFHDYSDGPQLKEACSDIDNILAQKAGKDVFVGGASHQKGAPVICTEFGGVNIALKKGDQGVEGEWGYTTASDSKDLLERVRKLMLGVIEGGICCGFVYTQL